MSPGRLRVPSRPVRAQRCWPAGVAAGWVFGRTTTTTATGPSVTAAPAGLCMRILPVTAGMRQAAADGSGFQAPIISPSPAYAASFPMSSRSSSPPALFPGGGEVTENGVCLLVQSIKHDISHRRVPFGTQRAAPVQIWWKRTNESVHAWFLWYTVRSTYTPHQLIATTQLYLLFTRTALPVTVTSNDPSVLDPVIAYL